MKKSVEEIKKFSYPKILQGEYRFLKKCTFSPHSQMVIIQKCDGASEKGPYLHLIKMASPVSGKTTKQNAFCPAQKLIQLLIIEYLEVKRVVWSYSYLNFDYF